LSYYNIELICNKCGGLNNRISNLKSVRDMLKPINSTCKNCGILLNPFDFAISAERRYEKFIWVNRNRRYCAHHPKVC